MQRQTKPPIERLLARIEIDPLAGCWLWPGATSGSGYGVIQCGTLAAPKMRGTHVVAFEHYNGPIPAGFEVDHLCRVHPCCNPDHLEAVTNSENSLRGNLCSRSLVCPQGHWILGDNVVVFSNGRRRCKECRNAAERARYRKSGR